MSTYPRITDNDRDEITATLDGKEIRGWSYKDDTERRWKMRMAREFVEGWFVASKDPKRAAAPEMFEALEAILSEETRSIHVGYDDGPGGGFYVYADAVRVDSPSFDLARAVLAKAKGE